MAENKKKKKDSQPKVPSYQNFDTGNLQQPWEDFYKPMGTSDYMDMYNQLMARFPSDYNTTQDAVMGRYAKDYSTAMAAQQQWVPQLMENQRNAQSTLYRNMAALQREQAPAFAERQDQILGSYSPQFKDTYARLGNRINEGLSSGYELGAGLSKEIEQGIRGAQMARGNWLGPAPTAQEVMGKGQAAENLYNTRIGQAQNYLQGQNPIDMLAKTGAATQMGVSYYPTSSYVDTGMAGGASGTGANLYGNIGNQASGLFSSIGNQQGNYNSAMGSAQGAYNSALLSANDQNNNWMYQNYDRNADAWSYREAARQGIYSTPQVGGGGGMGGVGSMVGGIAGGVGTAVSGLAAAGVIGGGAAAVGAGGAAAAASAAASALCWLARKLLPTKWKAYRKWLFTEASPEFRRKYTFNARRLANAIP